MSYRSVNTSATGKGIRHHHRAQYNWFRCSSVAESVEHWDSQIESGRYINSFKAFESTARRRPQLEGLGSAPWQCEDTI